METTAEGFRRAASGLLVPAEQSREREVWNRSEWKCLDKTVAFLESKGVEFMMVCPVCRGPLKRIRLASGAFTLRCDHRDRILSRER